VISRYFYRGMGQGGSNTKKCVKSMKHFNRVKNKIGYTALLSGICIACLWSAPAASAPKPAVIPPQGTWQLKIELHGLPQMLRFRLSGDTTPKSYWYLLYTINNTTGQDVGFFPRFELLTDTLQLNPGGNKARRWVFEAIQKRYQSSIPLLESQDQVTERILQGQDNARDSVALLEDFDPKANRVKILIAGLSNETTLVPHPTEIDPKTNKPKEILLRKTLMLEYKVAGDSLNPSQRTLLYRDRKWIMR